MSIINLMNAEKSSFHIVLAALSTGVESERILEIQPNLIDVVMSALQVGSAVSHVSFSFGCTQYLIIIFSIFFNKVNGVLA